MVTFVSIDSCCTIAPLLSVITIVAISTELVKFRYRSVEDKSTVKGIRIGARCLPLPVDGEFFAIGTFIAFVTVTADRNKSTKNRIGFFIMIMFDFYS